MTAIRLRSVWSDEELKNVYPAPHDHTRYGVDHEVRVVETIKFGLEHIPPEDRTLMADLSTGNAAIPLQLFIGADRSNLHLGDYAASEREYDHHGAYTYSGPLEETLYLIPPVDTYVCCETLEHLDDPLRVLQLIRVKARRLLLSTPVGNWDDGNLEHYWSWDARGVTAFLEEAEWHHYAYTNFDGRDYDPASYNFGMWAAR
jgi:hypothetical protein